eukprot:870152-Alexandrium_andersonii.AAC.1
MHHLLFESGPRVASMQYRTVASFEGEYLRQVGRDHTESRRLPSRTMAGRFPAPSVFTTNNP